MADPPRDPPIEPQDFVAGVKVVLTMLGREYAEAKAKRRKETR